MISKVQRNGKQIRFKEVWIAKWYSETDIALDTVNHFTDKEITGGNRMDFYGMILKIPWTERITYI